MSLEQQKAVVRRFFEEVINQRNLAMVDELVATEYVWHGPSQEVSSPQGLKQLIRVYLTAFPDLQMTFEDQLGEGDKIASRWTMRGTHQGDLFGLPPRGSRRPSRGSSLAAWLAARSSKNGSTLTNSACCNNSVRFLGFERKRVTSVAPFT